MTTAIRDRIARNDRAICTEEPFIALAHTAVGPTGIHCGAMAAAVKLGIASAAEEESLATLGLDCRLVVDVIALPVVENANLLRRITEEVVATTFLDAIRDTSIA
jgi:hypothetical protein